MKSLLVGLLLVMSLASLDSKADEDRLETTATLSGASVTFAATLNPGAEYYLLCSAATTYRTCGAGTCTAVAADFPVPVDIPMLLVPRDGRTQAAVLAASGTCKLYDSKPRLTTINRSQ